MIQAAIANVSANRHTAWVFEVLWKGMDLTGATFHAQIRTLPDAGGSALVDLTNAALGSQGINATLIGSDTNVVFQIDEATIEALPAAPEIGNDLTLYWDVQIDPVDGIKEVYFKGTFTVLAGVTQ